MKNRPTRHRSGFTLIEVLVATAVTLLMMVSLAKAFNIIGNSMQKGRAALELNNRLRNVALRIQSDLANATAMLKPPLSPDQGLGYLKYYDGPMTDYTALQYSLANASVQDLSRFGDTDDILMFTARADRVWFTGKVPLFVLQGNTPGTNTNDTELVNIASQYAEIALFCQPIVDPARTLDGTGSPVAGDNSAQRPNSMIVNPKLYQQIPGSDFPAKYRLHYRALLIRPDLNVGGQLPNGSVGGVNWLTAFQSQVAVGNGTFPLPSPTCDMQIAHQQCDLSIRRISAADGSAVAANSLEDLTNPDNRFAHVRVPLPNGTISMPVLSLGLRLDIPATVGEAGSTGVSDPNNALNPNSPGALQFQSGFLHPAFALNTADRIGEDILAADILAFDIQAYDPGAPILADPGVDTVWGTTADDDLNGTNNDVTEAGWDGSDDYIVSPADPGFSSALSGGTLMATGAYVDVGWGRKVRRHFGLSATALNTWSQLSCLDRDNFDADSRFPFTDAMYESGLVYQNATNGNPLILQPSFDTWTTQYEEDGILQSRIAANGSGTTNINGASVTLFPSFRSTVFPDLGTDGIDNNLTGGIDDGTEKETSPPIDAELRGLRISIRMEDPATGIIRQMSVGKEFVTTQ